MVGPVEGDMVQVGYHRTVGEACSGGELFVFQHPNCCCMLLFPNEIARQSRALTRMLAWTTTKEIAIAQQRGAELAVSSEVP